jgi:N6-adenosine-specific RNA methylase IME4
MRDRHEAVMSMPPVEFDVVYADPPWRYGNMTPSATPEAHYPTMALADICALTVPAAKNSVLYLWGTAPLLPEALQVMTAWGFTYKTGAVWDKERLGVGYWFRGQHEHLLVGVRGRVSPPAVPLRVPSVYRELSGRHSRKPDAIRDMIATWWPDARRLEMFCRYPAPGWHVWGNQVDSSVAHLPAAKFDPEALRRPGQDSLFGGAA